MGIGTSSIDINSCCSLFDLECMLFLIKNKLLVQLVNEFIHTCYCLAFFSTRSCN